MAGTCKTEWKRKDDSYRKKTGNWQDQFKRPILTNFTTLANELQKMLRLEVFSIVTSDRDKSN